MKDCTNEKEIMEIEVYGDGTIGVGKEKNGGWIQAAGAVLLLAGILLAVEVFEPVRISDRAAELSEENVQISFDLGEAADLRKYAETFTEKRTATLLLGTKVNINTWKENTKTVQSSDVSDRQETIKIAETMPDVILPEIEVPGKDVILPDEDAVLPESDSEAGNATEDSIIPDAGDIEESAPDIPMEDGSAVEGDIITGDGAIEEDDTLIEEIPDTPDTLTGFLVDGEGMIYGIDAAGLSIADGYLELPSEGCVGIRSGALSETGAGIAEIYIPANITVIEEGAFSELYMLEWIDLEPGNPAYMSIDGVLFDGGGTALVAFPGGRTDQYAVLPGVTYIAPNAFANTNLACLDFWQCGPVEIGTEVFGAHAGNGIRVKAPMEYLDWYRGQFAGYNVEIL